MPDFIILSCYTYNRLLQSNFSINIQTSWMIDISYLKKLNTNSWTFNTGFNENTLNVYASRIYNNQLQWYVDKNFSMQYNSKGETYYWIAF